MGASPRGCSICRYEPLDLVERVKSLIRKSEICRQASPHGFPTRVLPRLKPSDRIREGADVPGGVGCPYRKRVRAQNECYVGEREGARAIGRYAGAGFFQRNTGIGLRITHKGHDVEGGLLVADGIRIERRIEIDRGLIHCCGTVVEI